MDDVPEWVDPLEPVCAAVAGLLDPHGEVVLHDLATSRIVALWNPLSGRAVGDDSLMDDLPGDPSASAVIGPYAKVLPDGRRCTSVSAVLRDRRGSPQGLMCVNLDRSPLDGIAALATSLLAARVDPPAELFDRDWRERIAATVHDYCRDHGVPRGNLDRALRRDLVARLEAQGLFSVRRSADLAAEAMGVSRATVYALLKEIRS